MSMVLECSQRESECLWFYRVVQDTMNIYGPRMWPKRLNVYGPGEKLRRL